jgi:3-deoxy-7-phosphoheptulonate synthase
MAATHETWSPAAWRGHPALQQPDWPDQARLDEVRAQIAGMPPLVFAGEARSLLDRLAGVAAGRAFLLQAGDCAESFYDWNAPNLREKLKIILQMSAVLTYAASLPVVKLGRIAGQFVKPRSQATEKVGDLVLPAFRGHIVNSEEPTQAARTPDPERMLHGYHQAASTLNLLRAFTKGGFADLAQVHVWNQEFVANSPEGRRYEQLATEIERAMSFMTAIGVDMRNPALHQTDIWTSHEALLLDFEEALTRKDSLTGDWYDCSAHFLWVGERTRQPDGAHVQFLAGVHNPVGVKLGPGATPEQAIGLCDALNPQRIPGRLTLITRMGAERVGGALPPLVRAVRDSEHPVVWVCDPMHANTFVTAGGRKTRDFRNIMAEIEGFFAVHHAEGTWPGGVHLEITGDDVTECLGGGDNLSEAELDTAYTTLCDPRLNARQSLDLAFHVAELMRRDPTAP